MDEFEILKGELILNTRPLHQQQELNNRFESLGATTCSLAAIQIDRAELTAFLESLESNLDHYDILLFVSRNAVNGFLSFLGSASLNPSLSLGVIGEGTLRTVKESPALDNHHLIEAYPYNSEGLLDSPELQSVNDSNILILRGQTGRNLLGDELTRRGARVSYCEVYKRSVPGDTSTRFNNLIKDRLPTLVVFTSNEGMSNFIHALDANAREVIIKIPWVLISERMRESAINLGHNAEIIIADLASDTGIELAVCEWQSRRHSKL